MFIKIKPGRCEIKNSNHYFGYNTVSTSEGKLIYVKGAPRLYQEKRLQGVVATDEVISDPENLKLASLITELLKCDDINKWGDFLTGAFLLVIINKKTSTCHIIVDLGNAYHLYSTNLSENEIILSTDIEQLALDTGKKNALDFVSITEYLTNQTITYPHTFYDGLSEVHFASCITVYFGSTELKVGLKPYWLPKCDKKEVCNDIEGLAIQLRNGLSSEMEKILSDKKNIGIFMSGGTDSRVLAGLIAESGMTGTAITVSDVVNPEVEIARKVAEVNGLRHEVILRDEEYYPNLIEDSLSVVGPHTNFVWHMFLGFREKINSFGFDALFGAYMSDTLLKLHEANVTGCYFLGRHLGTIEKFNTVDKKFIRGGSEFLKQFSVIFKEDILDQINQRRIRIMEYWNSMRNDGSGWEWSYMWPFERNKHNANLTTNIFNYPAYEIMIDRNIIEIARIASQKIKINGRLFNKATFPFISRASKIPVANTMVRPSRFQRWDEFRIALKQFLPNRIFLKDYKLFTTDNPVATHRCTTDLRKLWQVSTVLKDLRKGCYNASDVTQNILKDPINIFDKNNYGSLPSGSISHIMYTLLYLNMWREKRMDSS